MVLVALAAGVTVIIEQPFSSLMHLHPKFSMLDAVSSAGWIQLKQISCWLGLYGSDSAKPLRLWVSHPWAQVEAPQKNLHKDPDCKALSRLVAGHFASVFRKSFDSRVLRVQFF